MTELRSADGVLVAVEQGDGNFVVYDAATMRPLWDRWSAHIETVGSVPPWPEPAQPPPVTHPPTGGGARVIRVTSSGQAVNRMQGYWSNAYVAVGGRSAFVFAGNRDGRPRFYFVDLLTGGVEQMTWFVPYAGTTEGWHYDAQGRITLIDGPRLRRINPAISEDRVLFDISDTHPGHDLWQPHSSDDGETHSATVRRIVSEGAYPKVGTIAVRHGRPLYVPAQGTLDESQVSRDGRRIVIKLDRGDGDDNLVIDLDTRETRWLRDGERALGHSDCGPDYIVGEADKPDPGACVIRYLARLNEAPLILFPTLNMGHVSVRAGRCLWSGPTHLSLVALDGSGVTPLIEHGGGTGDDDRVNANLSPCGRVATYVQGGDVYLLILP